MKMTKNGQFLHQFRLGGPDLGFFLNAPPRHTSPPRRSEASTRHTCKSGFGSSFPLNLTIIHWNNEDPNK